MGETAPKYHLILNLNRITCGNALGLPIRSHPGSCDGCRIIHLHLSNVLHLFRALPDSCLPLSCYICSLNLSCVVSVCPSKWMVLVQCWSFAQKYFPPRQKAVVTRKKKSPLYVAVKSVFGPSMDTNAVSFWGTGLLGSEAMHREPLSAVPSVGSPSLWLNKQDDPPRLPKYVGRGKEMDESE